MSPDRRQLQSQPRVTRYETPGDAASDAAGITADLAAIIDRTRRLDDGPCILPYHAWMAVGLEAQDELTRRAWQRKVQLAVEWVP